MDRFPPVGGKQLGDIRLHIGQSVGAEICAVSGTGRKVRRRRSARRAQPAGGSGQEPGDRAVEELIVPSASPMEAFTVIGSIENLETIAIGRGIRERRTDSATDSLELPARSLLHLPLAEG